MSNIKNISVLWLRPSTGKNVSTRRVRIAEQLAKQSVQVEFQNMALSAPFSGLRSLLFGDHDVVISNVRFPLYASYPFIELRQKPFIADVSDPISQISDLPSPLFNLLYRYEEWILTQSDTAVFAESESYERAQKCDVDAVLAKNAVNYELFSDPSAQVVTFAQRELEAAGVDLDSPVALYAGRFAPVYHITETLAAAALATDWEFVFIGEHAQQEVIEHAAEHEPNVHYLGSYEHDRVPGFLQHADVGLCLVDIERPLKILEYGAAMLPVLGMPGDLQKEFSEEQLWFVEPIPKEIAAGLERIYQNPTESNQRSENLQTTASQNSWQAVADMYLEIIQEIAG